MKRIGSEEPVTEEAEAAAAGISEPESTAPADPAPKKSRVGVEPLGGAPTGPGGADEESFPRPSQAELPPEAERPSLRAEDR